MAFNFGTITADPPDFTSVPRTRTQYIVVTIPGSGGPVPTTVSAVSIPASPGSSDFLLLTPMAALGWQSGANGAVRTGLVAGDFPLRLVLGFKMPQGDAEPTVKLRVSGDSGQQANKTWTITQTTAGLAKISLIFDRSTSMGSGFCGTTSLAEAVEGVKVALALMANQDHAQLHFLDQAQPIVPMGELKGVGDNGTRDAILRNLPTSTVSAAADIPRAVGFGPADTTARIVFTDCNTATVPNLSRDSKRFVLAVPNRNSDVFAVVGGGRCLAVTDRISTVGNTRMNVRKLASQILLEAINTAISIDPQWVLGPSDIATLDFTANELDQNIVAIALTDRAEELDFRLVLGHADEPSIQGGGREALREVEVKPNPEQTYGTKHQPHPHACVRTVVRDNLVHATLNLTPELREESQGQFHVRVKRKPSSGDPKPPLPFALSVATDSDLTMNAQLHSSSLNVGADLLFSVVVSEAGIPPREARAHVELTYPDGGVSRVHLEEGPRGRFNAVLRSMRPGDYFARFLVEGATVLGTPFLREQSRALTLEPAGGCGESSR